MKRLVIIQFVLVAVLIVLSCGGQADISSDPSALAELNKLKSKMSTGQPLSQDEFAALTKTHERFPNSEEVQAQYEAALTQRRDWNKLIEFYEAYPNLANSKQKLATVSYQAGNYEKALTAANSLDPSEPNVRKIRNGSLYRLGRFDEAAKAIDSTWETILKEKSVDEIVFRGMIHFYKKENDDAIDLLKKALEINPDSIPAYNGLTRVYTATGKDDEARESIAKLRTAYDHITEKEKAKTRFVEKIYKLQEDFKAKRYLDVIVTGSQIEADVPSNQKKVFYQYLYQSYKALGREAEANDVLNKVKNLK